MKTIIYLSFLSVFVSVFFGHAYAMGSGVAEVSIHEVKSGSVPVQFEYVGEVEASKEIEVRARITGIIEKRFFKEGAYVNKGDILFELDDRPYKAALAQSEAELAAAKALKVRAVAELNKAKRDLTRIAPLSNKDLVSQNEIDNAQSAIDIAKAEIQQAEAAILQAKALINSQQINLDYTKVTAPISGLTSKVEKNEGSLVEIGSNSLLTHIAQIDPAHVNFSISEAEQNQRNQEILSNKIIIPASGYKVLLKNSSGKQINQSGKINYRDYKVNTKTGSFSIRASIENSQKNISPGQFVRVVLDGAYRPDAYVIPQQAVMDNPQGKFVYVVAENDKGEKIAKQKLIKVGEWVDKADSFSNAWIIKSGLSEGEQVIINGMARIFYPGMPVKIIEEQAESDSLNNTSDKGSAKSSDISSDKSSGTQE